MEKLVTPQEANIDALLQLIAALIDRLGGEVVISHRDYSMFDGVPVVQRNLSGGYVVLRLGDEDEVAGVLDIDRPDTE